MLFWKAVAYVGSRQRDSSLRFGTELVCVCRL